MSKINLAKRLSIGISNWLTFEYACQRVPVFSEKYLSFPIAQILNTQFGPHVKSEVIHPILGPIAAGRGRKPEIDFCVFDNYKSLKIAIESKWISSDVSTQTVEKILWDLIRLAMLGNNDHISCYFILAGKVNNLKKLFALDKFNGPPDKKGRIRPILKVRKSDFMNFRLDSPTDHRAELLKKIFKDCKSVKLPARLGTGKTFCWPLEPNNWQYQVFVWEVMPHPLKVEFIPMNHNYYK